MGTFYLTGMAPIYNLSNKMLQETNSLYPPCLILMGYLLLLLECGTSLLLLILQPMEVMYIHTTASDLKETIQKDSVLETIYGNYLFSVTTK